MKQNNNWIVILAALAAGGFIWAINERELRKKQEKESQELETDYLKLLTLYLDEQRGIPDDIKQQLVHLREKYVGIHDAVAIELKSIIELIDGNKEEVAIEKLTKVIENLLKERYVVEGLAKNTKDCPGLSVILKKALDLHWISKHEFNFSCFLKDERNYEAHELAVKFPANWRYISFLAGIEIIYNLKGIPR